jgi:hypothetical protein
MSDAFFYLLSLSIIFAAILGVIRFRGMDPAYHPFVYYACTAVLVETIVFVLLSNGKKNIVPTVYNLNTLAEFYLLTLMFHKWGLFKRKRQAFIAIIALSFLLFFSTLYVRGYWKLNYIAKIFNAFTLIFFSISSFNTMILNERNNIFKNAKFWICIGMVISYTYFLLVSTEQLSFLNLRRTDDFEKKIWLIQAYANLFVNLMYAVAVVWIPRKKTIITLL